MGKRCIVPFLRQVGLVCYNHNYHFGFVTSSTGSLTLPLKTITTDNMTFRTCLMSFCQELQLATTLIGIAHLDIGNDGISNYFRCIYYAQTTQQYNHDQLLFASHDDPKIDSQTYKLLATLLSNSKKICNTELFREGFTEEKPRNPELSILIDLPTH